MITGVINIMPYLYKSQPVWSNVDGDILAMMMS
jgi:hypothetical protein